MLFTANIDGGVDFEEHGLLQKDWSSLLNDRIDIADIKINICSDLTLSYWQKFIYYSSCNSFDTLFHWRNVSFARTTGRERRECRKFILLHSKIHEKLQIRKIEYICRKWTPYLVFLTIFRRFHFHCWSIHPRSFLSSQIRRVEVLWSSERNRIFLDNV